MKLQAVLGPRFGRPEPGAQPIAASALGAKNMMAKCIQMDSKWI